MALALLPVLMGVAAAQPVVVRHKLLGQRLDVQAFFVFDTSTSMSARTGPHGLSRLERAKQEAEEVIPKLGDIPVGVASFTDRVLPYLMPTTDSGAHPAHARAVGGDRPAAPEPGLHRARDDVLGALPDPVLQLLQPRGAYIASSSSSRTARPFASTR